MFSTVNSTPSVEDLRIEGRSDCCIYGELLDDDPAYVAGWLEMFAELVAAGQIPVNTRLQYPIVDRGYQSSSTYSDCNWAFDD